MKYLILLITSLNIFLAPVNSQWQRCVGRPCKFILNIPKSFKRNVSKTIFFISGIATCNLPPHLGNRGCAPRVMWYYDRATRSCREMWWRGCGGNTNRWCNKHECELWCRRFPVG